MPAIVLQSHSLASDRPPEAINDQMTDSNLFKRDILISAESSSFQLGSDRNKLSIISYQSLLPTNDLRKTILHKTTSIVNTQEGQNPRRDYIIPTKTQITSTIISVSSIDTTPKSIVKESKICGHHTSTYYLLLLESSFLQALNNNGAKICREHSAHLCENNTLCKHTYQLQLQLYQSFVNHMASNV